MIEPPPPILRLAIDRDALAANWRTLDRMSGSARAGAAVKANAYGLGSDICVPVLRDAGCADFFVAHWSEVASVAAHVPAHRIAVLHGVIDDAQAAYARAIGARPVINSLHQARLWTESGGGPCHLMVDTGINRLGIRPAEIGDPVIQALDVQVLMSHLACADEDSAMNARQARDFQEVLPLLAHREASLANSAGIALGAQYHFDLTRPGLALYGGVPHPSLGEPIRTVATPEAAIMMVKNLSAGESVGYNAAYTARAPMRVGTVSLGYADGILRAWGGGAFKHDGRVLPMLGRVSMDMIVIDLSAADDLREGDWVRLPYRLPDAAERTGLSQYELLTALGQRFG